jgi:hypothetical protein
VIEDVFGNNCTAYISNVQLVSTLKNRDGDQLGVENSQLEQVRIAIAFASPHKSRWMVP